MTDLKYKKWDEIVNPSLERSRKRKKLDPLEEEIARALGMEDKTKKDARDIWGNMEEKASEKIGKGAGDKGDFGKTGEGAREKRDFGKTGGEARDKGDFGKTGGGIRDKGDFGKTGGGIRDKGDFGKTGEGAREKRDFFVDEDIPKEGRYSCDIEMTDEERKAYHEKRKKLKSLMNEFVSWKESL